MADYWQSFLERLRASFWFLPSLMAFASTVVALVMVHLDRLMTAHGLTDWFWGFDGGASGARELVSTVAGSMITVAGVVFSITIVTLSLTSQQFGPRLVRNFLRDRPTQAVLGCFVGTFLYCLLVLRAIRSPGEAIVEFVPNVSVALAVVLAVVAVFVLVYFIHHTANAIRAPTLAWRTSVELIESLERLYPKSENGEEKAEEPLRLRYEGVAINVAAKTSGYVQRVDRTPLKEFEARYGLGVTVKALPGGFVVPGDTLFTVPAGLNIPSEATAALVSGFHLGLERTLAQDPGFGFAMLVEMAVRSVSPSMNDPFTAVQCVDRLREGLTIVAARPYPEGGIWPLPTFTETLDECWRTLTFYARDNPPVMRHMSLTLKALQAVAWRAADQEALARWQLASVNPGSCPEPKQ